MHTSPPSRLHGLLDPDDGPFVEPEPSPPEPNAAWRTRAHWIALVALTVFAGLLRFIYIDRPLLWGDECMVYSRVCGTYGELLEILQYDGFAPLHYELYWVIAQFFTLTPSVMRFVPALAGTAMVPAMYFLGRELVGRRAALLAAGYAACSAYLLWYARDAKMYMHFWLFCTLSFACLLWWLRARTVTAWLAWIACSGVMVGLHAPGLILLSIQPLLLCTHGRLRWWSMARSLRNLWPKRATAKPQSEDDVAQTAPSAASWRGLTMFLAGLLLISVGPAAYYLGFNQWTEKIEEQGWARASGLAWLDRGNARRSDEDLLRQAAGSYLFSWPWSPTAARQAWYSPLGEARSDARPDEYARRRAWTGVITVGLLMLCGLGLLPWSAKLRGVPPNPEPTPWWRSSLAVILWVMLPGYGIYCASLRDPVSPGWWIASFGDLFHQHWVWAIVGAALVGALCLAWRYVATILSWLLFAAAVGWFARCWWQQGLRSPWQAIDAWLGTLLDWRVILGLAILVPALAWYYSGQSMRQRWRQTAAMTTVIVAAFGLLWAVYWGATARSPGSIWTPRYVGLIWPALAIGICALLARLPTRPLRAAAATLLLAANLLQTSGRIVLPTQSPADRIARDMWDARDPKGSMRVFSEVQYSSEHIRGIQSMYYLHLLSGTSPTPVQLHRQPPARSFESWTLPNPFRQASNDNVRTELRRSPQVNHVVVWDLANPSRREGWFDRMARTMGGRWQCVEREHFQVFSHQSWTPAQMVRRRVFMRLDPPLENKVLKL